MLAAWVSITLGSLALASELDAGQPMLAEAIRHFEAKEYAAAEPLFEIFIRKYPGEKGYLEAHRQLAEARIAQKEYRRAVTPLAYYVRAINTPANQLVLARTLLRAGSFTSALMNAKTLLERKPVAGAPALEPAQKQEALVLMATAQLALKQHAEAVKTLDQAGPPTPESAFLRARIRLEECRRFPSAPRLSEEQTIDQFERKAQCLLDTLSLYKQAAALPEADKAPIPAQATAREAIVAEAKGLQDYANTPPKPEKGRPNAQYARELSTLLRQKLETALKDALALAVDPELQTSLRTLKGK